VLNAVFVGLLLVVLAGLLPRLLQWTWDTAPLGRGPVRELLEAVAWRARFRARDLLVWRTGNLMANAAIVGLYPQSRVVLFSDSLLSMLGPRELAAVFAHEIGHAMRHHVVVFLTWVVAFFLGGELLISAVLEGVDGGGEWWAVGLGVAVFVSWFLVFGWLSRRFELEADLYSVDLLGDAPGLISALERVGGRLRDVAGWRHFSTADRIAFIARAISDPAFVGRFRRRLRMFTLAGAVLAAVALLGHGVALAASWSRDRVVVELCLGRYGEASERVMRVEDVDEWMERLVATGARLEEELGARPTAEQLSRALESSLESGELERAATLAGLLELREARGTSGLALVLGALADGEVAQAAREFDGGRGLDGRWRRLLASRLEPQ
jgi:Zn-dependent protease with chaperone function